MPETDFNTRVTIRQVAQEAAVSSATVSMVLKGDQRISENTQQRVMRAVEKLGYRPDPALSALAAYRHHQRHKQNYDVIGFIDTFEDFAPQGGRTWFADYLSGLRNQCERYGYVFESYSASQGNTTKHRQLTRKLYNRGIRGIVIGPFKDQTTALDLDWSKFSVVATSVSNESSGLPYAAHDFLRSFALVGKKLLELGYQRIAFVQPIDIEERLDYRWVAAYLRETYRHRENAERFLPPWLMDPIENHHDYSKFAQWIDQNQPDVIITSRHTLFAQWFKSIGIRVPEDIGLVGLQVEADQKGFSGIAQNTEFCGQLTIDLLHSMLLRREVGQPSSTYNINVSGEWVPGKMVRAQS